MNNDLISREALKEDLIKFFPIDCLEGIESKTLFNQILTDINNAPTVDTTCSHCDSGYAQGYSDGYLKGIEERPQGEWNTHQVACILAELFGDTCACNYCGIDEWLPKVCDFANKECPDGVGVACWEQFLKHRAKMERSEEE